MVDAIYRRGPWSVEVLPCWLNELVCKWAAEIEESFFYFYKTLFSKLNITLPFMDFDSHPASSQHLGLCAGIRAVERRSRQGALIKCLFLEHFFWVAANRTGPSILFDKFGDSLFPLYWTDQLAILFPNCVFSYASYSVKGIATLKAHSSRSTTMTVGEVVVATSPLSTT
ncbi:hypothetical protein CR513_41010, partial [Mucuna pruriens]